jgi:hypothetical protein
MQVAETFAMSLDGPMLAELAARGTKLPPAAAAAAAGGKPPGGGGDGGEEGLSLSAFARLDT